MIFLDQVITSEQKDYFIVNACFYKLIQVFDSSSSSVKHVHQYFMYSTALNHLDILSQTFFSANLIPHHLTLFPCHFSYPSHPSRRTDIPPQLPNLHHPLPRRPVPSCYTPRPASPLSDLLQRVFPANPSRRSWRGGKG